MSDMHAYPPPSGGSGLKIPILFGLVIALLAATVYLFVQLDHVRTDMAKMQESMMNELSSVKEASSVTTQTQRRNIEGLRDELETARRQAAMAAGQAKVEATKHAEDLAKRLAAEQAREQAAIKQEVSQVKEVATAATSKIGEVSSEVGSVKTEVAANKSELQNTIAELKRVRGDLGETSGLVATNGKELAALKALGERNYFEFSLKKAKDFTRVGDIAVLLKKADMKRNKFTIEIMADDKKVEKKDRTVNEPLQFYVAKARQPYELVINQVGKDLIAGYLATPKVQAARN
ncbi:MAG: hypothetical protein SFV54_26775 [Bryobacteraceae bacterium]|nr:hypothetical protein [Bryobacteraceae bacterium]